MERSCERGNEPSGSIKCRETTEWCSAPLSYHNTWKVGFISNTDLLQERCTLDPECGVRPGESRNGGILWTYIRIYLEGHIQLYMKITCRYSITEQQLI
jgi:hypothetical protein